jgi:ribosomal protein L29
MKRKDLQELKNKPLAELERELQNYLERLRELRFSLAQGKVKNIKEIKSTKKTIARILGLIRNYKLKTK